MLIFDQNFYVDIRSEQLRFEAKVTPALSSLLSPSSTFMSDLDIQVPTAFGMLHSYDNV